MRRSLGFVERGGGGHLVFIGAAFGKEETEGGRVSWIWKDRQTVETEVGKGEGWDGDEEGEAVGDAVGVRFESVCSVSSLGSKGVRGGTSSTSTSE